MNKVIKVFSWALFVITVFVFFLPSATSDLIPIEITKAYFYGLICLGTFGMATLILILTFVDYENIDKETLIRTIVLFCSAFMVGTLFKFATM